MSQPWPSELRAALGSSYTKPDPFLLLMAGVTVSLLLQPHWLPTAPKCPSPDSSCPSGPRLPCARLSPDRLTSSWKPSWSSHLPPVLCFYCTSSHTYFLEIITFREAHAGSPKHTEKPCEVSM